MSGISENAVFLVGAGIVLLPVLAWSDALDSFFMNFMGVKKPSMGARFIYTLIIIVVGAVILWGLSRLMSPNGGLWSTAVFIFALGVVFLVAKNIADLIHDWVAQMFNLSETTTSYLIYAIVITIAAILLLWILSYFGGSKFTLPPARNSMGMRL